MMKGSRKRKQIIIPSYEKLFLGGRMFQHRSIIVIICVSTVFWASLCVTEAALETDEARLHVDLFKKYNRNILPVLNRSDSVVVLFDVQIIRIIDVSEREQFIKTYSWINQYWKNPLLTWDPSKYGGVKEIHVHPNQVWVPDILLYNNVDEEDRLAGGSNTYKTNINIKHDGNTSWLNPALFKSICSIDVTYFPFDDQECRLKFGSWSFDASKIDMYPQTTDVWNNNYIKNGEWKLENISAKRNVKGYSCCANPFADVTIVIQIRRESIDYILKLIIPCSLISSMIFLGFILPPESGERIGLSITVLLAMTVFQQLTSEIMPSYGFPLLGQYYFATMVEIGLSLLVTTTILNIYHRNNRRMPNILRKVILNWLYRALFPCKRRKHRWDIEKNTQNVHNSHDGDIDSNSDFSLDETLFENPVPKSPNDPWLCLRECTNPYKLPANGTTMGTRESTFSNNLSKNRHFANANTATNGHLPRPLNLGFKRKQTTTEKQRRQTRKKNAREMQRNPGESIDSSETKQRNQKEWIKAARVLDRFFLIISVTTGVLTLFTIFLKAPRFGIW